MGREGKGRGGEGTGQKQCRLAAYPELRRLGVHLQEDERGHGKRRARADEAVVQAAQAVEAPAHSAQLDPELLPKLAPAPAPGKKTW